MIEIKNKTKGPVQVVIRSRMTPRNFTVLNIPGIGASKNVVYLEDERHTEYVDRVERMGLITTRYIPNSEVEKVS